MIQTIIILIIAIAILITFIYFKFRNTNLKIQKLNKEKDSLKISRDALIDGYNDSKKKIKNKKKLIEKLETEEVGSIEEFNNIINSTK